MQRISRSPNLLRLIQDSSGASEYIIFHMLNPFLYLFAKKGCDCVFFFSGCGGTILGASGNITSPNYPNNYPSRVECLWVVTVPTGSISIIFNDFLVEDHSRCNYDFVEIR